MYLSYLSTKLDLQSEIPEKVESIHFPKLLPLSIMNVLGKHNNTITNQAFSNLTLVLLMYGLLNITLFDIAL